MKKKSIEVFESILNTAIKYFKWILLVAVAIILLTGVYKVDSNEVALVLRFGALTGATREAQIKQPGLHFSLPSFIDEVIKVPVESIQETTVNTLYGTGDTLGVRVQAKGYAITGDSNIVRMKIVLKYKINDPISYALYMGDVPAMLDGIVSSEITSIVAGTVVDDVLTTEKSTITSQGMKKAQQEIDRLRLGVQLTNIELTNITPPAEATDAFNKATTASVEKKTLIEQANDYKESAIPAAEAKAQGLINDAEANKAAKIAEANAVAEEFNGLYDQFSRNPDVIRNGVFRTRIAKLLEKCGKSIVVPNADGTKVVLPN